MLVVIDIGNTNITIGIYHGDKLIGNYRLTTKMKRTSDEYGFMVMNFLNACGYKRCHRIQCRTENHAFLPEWNPQIYA